MLATMTTLLGQADDVPLDDLPPLQKIVAIIVAVLILLIIIELVRQRKLREEYSVLWIVTGVALLVLALNYNLLLWITSLFGMTAPHSALLFLGILFLILLSLQFSIRLSRLTHRVRGLSQKVALLEEELRDASENDHPGQPEERDGQ